MLLAAIVLGLAQAGIGMAVNLYATIPPRHPGAGAGDYFGGSVDGAAWAIGPPRRRSVRTGCP